jgi:hypothetical protein
VLDTPAAASEWHRSFCANIKDCQAFGKLFLSSVVVTFRPLIRIGLPEKSGKQVEQLCRQWRPPDQVTLRLRRKSSAHFFRRCATQKKGQAIFGPSKLKSPSHHAIRKVLQKTPEGRSLLREEQLARVRACRDIVRDWDLPNDFSLWREVFASSLSSASGDVPPSAAEH